MKLVSFHSVLALLKNCTYWSYHRNDHTLPASLLIMHDDLENDVRRIFRIELGKPATCETTRRTKYDPLKNVWRKCLMADGSLSDTSEYSAPEVVLARGLKSLKGYIERHAMVKHGVPNPISVSWDASRDKHYD